MTTAPSAAATRRAVLLVAGAVAVAVALAIVVLGRRAHREGEAGGPKRVVVLPFENLGSPEDDG